LNSQFFTGRNSLLARLTSQVGSEELAKSILIKRGHMYPDGTLTPEGQVRNTMTAEERAKDRAARETGLPTRAFRYDYRTNKAVRK
jgi:hypothetical protein